MSKNRETFASRLGFILVSAGCAVGLGNVWKFPYVCGNNGGAIFILIYLVCLFALGFPILVCEFAIGRGSGASIGTALRKLSGGKGRWHQFRWYGLCGNYLLMMFYTVVAGWMIYYVGVCAKGTLRQANVKEIEQYYQSFMQTPGKMMFFMLLVVALCIGVCALGLQNGIENITKKMMLALIVLMAVMAVNSVMLKGSSKGLSFYLIPNLENVKKRGLGNVIFDAMTQAFFTLSVGMGSMEIFGSYLGKERKLTGEAINVLVLDTLIAFVAGIIVIPACISFGIRPDAGPSLLFITLPNVFNEMPGSRIWGAMFFLFMSFAALSTIIAVFQNILSFAQDLWGWSLKKAIVFNAVLIIVLSLPCALGFNVWSFIQPLGAGTTIQDLEDFIVSNNILPIGSLIYLLFCVTKYGWGWDNFMKEANEGKGIKFPKWPRIYITYILPLIVLFILVQGYIEKF